MGQSLKIKLDKKNGDDIGHFIFVKMKERGMAFNELVAKVELSGKSDMDHRRLRRILEDNATVTFEELFLIIDLVGLTEADIRQHMRARGYYDTANGDHVL